MATLLLSAAGASIGSGIGGSLLGLSGAVVGRAVGATLGQSIDQRVLGSTPSPTFQGKIDRFHLSGAGYGSPVKQVWGRSRIAGEIIWASRFLETRTVSQGSKGTRRPSNEAFSYSVSIAIALCEGEALTVGRVWADSNEIAMNSIDLRFYPGSDDQLPDPKIEAVEGIGFAPSYRGICYVVIENLELSKYGNRVPQFSFEVIRHAKNSLQQDYSNLASSIRAVAMIPGSGEYALATTPVHFNLDLGVNRSANVHSIQGITDFSNSLIQLNNELPDCRSVSLVVSWFGDDLRCNVCQIKPKVEQTAIDGVEMPWVVSGVARANADVLTPFEGKPVYGGTPTDQSIVEAIAAIHSAGKEVMFYPFILMDQIEGNTLPNPWATSSFQPALPWRGRITLSVAPGIAGTVDQTEAAEVELSSFLGNATSLDFAIGTNTVEYNGSLEWSYRRFILHYAHLCSLAGGVETFCIGSEMRGLTTARSSVSTFPMVSALKELAAEVKEILGSSTNVTYAADWSEYFGYHVDDDVFFHLDPLWADQNIDFIGIDNYMPLSDWRVGADHTDAHWNSVYNIDYLLSNVMGGEGYDWFYETHEGAANQRRIKISNDAFGEDWVYRFKDLHSWWANDHHNRIGGIRSEAATEWRPQTKKIVFTEYGCAAIDKGTNQPNLFIDQKSSESSLPRDSSGFRDDLIQLKYFQAIATYWQDRKNNPISSIYHEAMVDIDRCHAWAWDARPFPNFPAVTEIWGDAENYDRGHWLNGRTSNQLIPSVINELFSRSGCDSRLDTHSAYGVIRGYTAESSSRSRDKIENILSNFGLNFREKEGSFDIFSNRSSAICSISIKEFAIYGENPYQEIRQFESSSSAVNRLRLSFIEAGSDHAVQIVETAIDQPGRNFVQAEIDFLVTRSEAELIAKNRLVFANSSLKSWRFATPKSNIDIFSGDVISIGDDLFMVREICETDVLIVEAAQLAAGEIDPGLVVPTGPSRRASVASTPPFVVMLDLPIIADDVGNQAPFAAVFMNPWPNSISVWSSASITGFELNTVISVPSIIGRTISEMTFAQSDVWDRGTVLRVRLSSGFLNSSEPLDVLNGTNLMAIGDPLSNIWEIFQFSRAELVAESVFDLSFLIRGLSGTDAVMPLVWPVGSLVVLIDGSLQRISMPVSFIGLERNYRVGASELGAFDQSTASLSRKFLGISSRPYSISHLRALRGQSGDIAVNWVRRTRVDGDRWHFSDVPVGEEDLVFSLKIFHGSDLVRQVFVADVFYTYSAQMQNEDSIFGPVVFEISQISSFFGPGPASCVTMN